MDSSAQQEAIAFIAALQNMNKGRTEKNGCAQFDSSIWK
jgi:hypothetical protein